MKKPVDKLKSESIEKLYMQLEAYHDKAFKVRKAIEAMQELCEHEYIDNGHDSHKDHYCCAICGHEMTC